jgi:hypothetical protein
MNYLNLKKSIDVGNTTYSIRTDRIINVDIPTQIFGELNNSIEYLDIQTKNFDDITGSEKDPTLVSLTKENLENDKKILNDQKTLLETQISLIDDLLSHFV